MKVELISSYERNNKKYIILEIDDNIALQEINIKESNFFRTPAIPSIPTPSISIDDIVGTRYVTNKWDTKRGIEDGWIVAYGREITETDFIEGIVATGISIYTANPEALYLWINNLIEESIARIIESIKEKLTNEVKDQAIIFAMETIKGLVSDKSGGDVIKEIGGIGFKAGVASYTGHNQAKALGSDWHTISTTNAFQPYVGIKIP
ncbi:hypothetical protein ACSXCW_03640 [Clostridium perfringens]